MALKWYGEQCTAKIKNHVGKRLEIASRRLRDHMRVRMSIAYKTALQGLLGRGRGRHALPRGGRGVARAFVGASSAGTYPFKRTGHLRRNVQQEVDHRALVARVGTNVLYGRYLEFGTRRMAPRPWLSRALAEKYSEIRSILECEIGTHE